VNRDGVRELRPGKGVDLQNIVKELDQFVGMLPYTLHLIGLVDAVEMTSDLFDAAPRRPDDVVVSRKILNEETLSCGGIRLISAVGHRLPTARPDYFRFNRVES